MNKFIAISDARATLPDLVSGVNKNIDRTIITVNGQPKAVLLSIEELESIEETAEIMAIPGMMKDLKKSQDQFRKGEFIELSKLLNS